MSVEKATTICKNEKLKVVMKKVTAAENQQIAADQRFLCENDLNGFKQFSDISLHQVLIFKLRNAMNPPKIKRIWSYCATEPGYAGDIGAT